MANGSGGLPVRAAGLAALRRQLAYKSVALDRADRVDRGPVQKGILLDDAVVIIDKATVNVCSSYGGLRSAY